MIKKSNEFDIFYRPWLVDQPKAICLLIHGLGGHSQRWESFARFFLQHKISSYAIELRGFGQTKEIKGHIDSFEIYLNDVDALSQIIQQEHPAVPLFLIGESLGGLIAFLMAIKKPMAFAGLICLSPAFKSILKFSILDQMTILASALVHPKKQFAVPFNAQMCTRDSDYQQIIEKDAREHRIASARLLTQILLAQFRAKFLASQLKTPTLFLLSQRDLLVDTKISQNIFHKLRVEDMAIIQYPTMYHGLSIDLEKENVFTDILTWLMQRLS